MKLYYAPGACSLSPHIVFSEAGIPVETIKVDLKTHQLPDGGDFYKISPRGYVPVIELDNGERLTEGPAIVQYLADQKPDSGLAPKAGTMERVRLQEWLNFISAELHKTWGAMFNPKIGGDWKQATLDRLGLRLDYFAKQIEGKQFVMGDRFTVADAYAFTILNWAGPTGVDLSRWPGIKAYQARVGARPKVQETLKAEGLVK